MWKVLCGKSGTMVITTHDPSYPVLSVRGPSHGDREEQDMNTFVVATDLCAFINGGLRPQWLNDMRRVRQSRITDLDGTTITAVGPDNSVAAKLARAKLIDGLVKHA